MPQKCVSSRGSAPDPAGGAYSAPPDPLGSFEGAASPAYAYKSVSLLQFSSPYISFVWSLKVLEKSLNLILTNGREPWSWQLPCLCESYRETCLMDVGHYPKVQCRRLRMAGHIIRMPPGRPANHAMSWTPRGSGRRRGRPTKTWRSTFKEDWVDRGVDWNSVRAVATDRSRWRTLAAYCPVKDWRI